MTRPLAKLTLVAVLALSTPVAGQELVDGFLRGQGVTDFALSGTFESYDRFWRGSQPVESPALGTIETRSISLFVAHGLTDRLDLVVPLPWVESSVDGTSGLPDQEGLHDGALFAKYRLKSLDLP